MDCCRQKSIELTTQMILGVLGVSTFGAFNTACLIGNEEMFDTKYFRKYKN